jgi:hypothetical protein
MPQEESSRGGWGFLGVGNGVLAVLSVLCIVGIILLYAGGKASSGHELADLPYMLGITAIFGVLDVVVVVWVLFWIFRSPRTRVQDAIDRDDLRTVLRVLGWLLLGAAVTAAVVIFLFATCVGVLSTM